MILDKKGKLFGKISLVDIAIVGIVGLLLFGTYVRFFGTGLATIGMRRDVEIEFVLRVEGVRNFTTDTFFIGDKIADVDTNRIIGEVVDIHIEDTERSVRKADGTHVLSIVPERYTMDLTIRTEVREQDDGYWVRGNRITQGATGTMFVSERHIFAGDVIQINRLDDDVRDVRDIYMVGDGEELTDMIE